LLQRRKSAAAGVLQKHVITSASNGGKPAVKRAGNGRMLWGALGIIKPSHINSWMFRVSRPWLSTVDAAF